MHVSAKNVRTLEVQPHGGPAKDWTDSLILTVRCSEAVGSAAQQANP